MKIFGRNPTFSLSATVIYLSFTSLILAALFIYLVSGEAHRRAIKTGFVHEAIHNAKIVEHGLVMTMREDLTPADLDEFAQSFQLGLADVGIRIHRASAFYPDDQVEMVAINREAHISTTGDDRVRYLYPVIANEGCQSCHTVPVGAALGVIELSFPLSSITVPLNQATKSAFYYTMFGMWLMFAMLYLNLRFKLIAPITQIAKDIRAITTGRDWRQRVRSHSNITEVRSLTDDFNDLIGVVQDDWLKLEDLAIKDPLTGLLNRRGFNLALDQEFRRAERYGHQFCIILIDLDNFKFINDTYGHPAGDAVLVELASRLGGCLRVADAFARIGGDEFVLVLPETDAVNGLQVARKLHASLTGGRFSLPHASVMVTASIGVACYPKDGADYEALHAAVDAVLYKAKRSGKNRVVTLDESTDNDPTLYLGRTADRLRRALDENRVEAALQPIVPVKSDGGGGSVFAHEALARIVEDGTIITAGEFIEAAEEAGLIKDFDIRVLHLGLERLKTLPGKMFFNFSAATFSDTEWMRGLPSLLDKQGIDCSRVVIEITEREALPHIDTVKVIIDELRQYGIQFAIDDFGSGFSCFLYIKSLNVDYLKIEGSFIRQMSNNLGDRIIVESIQHVASRFGLKTVAEFVEDDATAKMLAEIGVDTAQGYHYGKPQIPAKAAQTPDATLRLQTKLPDGSYRTAAGSEVCISRNGGKSVAEFDWLEEGGCIDCVVDPYEQDGKLTWHCDECGGGSAALNKVAFESPVAEKG